MLTKKPEQMKKVFCFDICSCHYLRQSLSTSDLSFSQVTSVEQREPRKHFSASAYGLGFKNFFLGTLFSTSVTWEKLKSDVDKLCLRRGKNKYRNKILLLHWSYIYSVLHKNPTFWVFSYKIPIVVILEGSEIVSSI